MQTKTLLLSGAMVVIAVGALAHSGVQNPAVKARMEAMKEIAGHAKVLGEMMKGEAPFDAARARRAAEAIAAGAAGTPALFAAEETDPVSEARPVIWEDFADFRAEAEALETVAAQVADRMESAADIRPALREIGARCRSCHETYRE